MYNVTTDYKNAITSNTRSLHCKITMQTMDGTIYELQEGTDIRMGSITLDSNCMSGGFEIGTCYASDFSVSLDNTEGRWNSVDLTGATLWPYAGVELGNGTIEYVPLGVFIVDEPSLPYSFITLHASDRLILLDKPLDGLSAAGGITNATLLALIGTHCNVPIALSAYEELNMDHVIQDMPDPSGRMSCRDAVQEIAFMAGGFARMNRQGELDIFTLEKSELLNYHTWGEYRIPGVTWGQLNSSAITYSDVSGIIERTTYGELNTDGVTWGQLKEKSRLWGSLKVMDYNDPELDKAVIFPSGSRYNFSQESRKITVTGIIYKGTLYGTYDYPIEVSDLNLLADDDAEAVLSAVLGVIGGITYTAYTADYPGDPAIDCGDIVYHATYDGRTILSYVTGLTYRHSGKSQIKAEAKSLPALSYEDANTRRLAQVSARTEEVDLRLTTYEQATSQLADLLIQGLGVYGPTSIENEDGSKVIYLHDRPTLAESQELFCLSGGLISWSDDGGQTWDGGLTASSRLVIRIIEAKKIRAEDILLADGDDLQTAVTQLEAGHINISDYSSSYSTLEEFVTNIMAGNISLYYQDATSRYFGEISVRPEKSYFISTGEVYDEASVELGNPYAGQDYRAEDMFIYFNEAGDRIKVVYLDPMGGTTYDDTNGNALAVVCGVYEEGTYKYGIPESEHGTEIMPDQSYDVIYLYKFFRAYLRENFRVIMRSDLSPTASRFFHPHTSHWLAELLRGIYYNLTGMQSYTATDFQIDIDRTNHKLQVLIPTGEFRECYPAESFSTPTSEMLVDEQEFFDSIIFAEKVAEALENYDAENKPYFSLGEEMYYVDEESLVRFQYILTATEDQSVFFSVDKAGKVYMQSALLEGVFQSRLKNFDVNIDGESIVFSHLNHGIGGIDVINTRSELNERPNTQSVRLFGYPGVNYGLAYKWYNENYKWLLKAQGSWAECFGTWTFNDDVYINILGKKHNLANRIRWMGEDMQDQSNKLAELERRIYTLENQPQQVPPVIYDYGAGLDLAQQAAYTPQTETHSIRQMFLNSGGMIFRDASGDITGYRRPDKKGGWMPCLPPEIWFDPNKLPYGY